jgi:hypothetical protein
MNYSRRQIKIPVKITQAKILIKTTVQSEFKCIDCPSSISYTFTCLRRISVGRPNSLSHFLHWYIRCTNNSGLIGLLSTLAAVTSIKILSFTIAIKHLSCWKVNLCLVYQLFFPYKNFSERSIGAEKFALEVEHPQLKFISIISFYLRTFIWIYWYYK